MTEEEKKEMIKKHIQLELDIFLTCYRKLRDEGETRLVFECFLLHARNLLSFFNTSVQEKNRREFTKNDVVAEEFINETVPVVLRGDTAERINRQLQHISWERLPTRRKQRNLFAEEFGNIHNSIIDGVKRYNAKVTIDDYRLKIIN